MADDDMTVEQWLAIKSPSGDLETILRSARPRLICRADNDGSQLFKLTPYIIDVDRGWDDAIMEGFDLDQSPLGPVYWRIIKRGDEQFYCSTFLAMRDQIIKAWGKRGLTYLDPVIGAAVAQIESFATVHPVGGEFAFIKALSP